MAIDTYIVDDLGDTIVETSTGGTDTVQTALTYTLGTGVEKLVLLGTGSINGTGNAFANTITGTSGNNILTGGDGNDTLIGGAGADHMVGGWGIDTISYETAAAGVYAPHGRYVIRDRRCRGRYI